MKHILLTVALVCCISGFWIGGAQSEERINGLFNLIQCDPPPPPEPEPTPSLGASANVKVESVFAPPTFPNVGVHDTRILPGGIEDITSQLPRFAYPGLTPVDISKDMVLDVYTVAGNWTNLIRTPELTRTIIKEYKDLITGKWAKIPQAKIRYRVLRIESGYGVGGSSGSALGGSASRGSTGLGGGLLGAFGFNLWGGDHYHVIEYYQIL